MTVSGGISRSIGVTVSNAGSRGAAIAGKHKLPVHFIGIGESVDDLAPFEARDFSRAIAGIE